MNLPREISFLRLAFWQIRLGLASMTRGSGARIGQRLIMLGLGLVWFSLMAFGLYWTLAEAVGRTPDAVWLYDLVLYSAWLGSLAMVLFFNLGFLLHVVFFSRDMPFLMAAPLSPAKVLGIRFLEGMWSNLLLNLFLTLPASLAVGLAAGAGPFYYVTFLLAQLAFLMIPVALTYLVGIPLARFVSTSRLRAVFSIIGFGLAVFFWSLPQLAPSHIQNSSEWSELLHRGQTILQLFRKPVALLWPSTWAASAQVSALHGEVAASFGRLAILLGGAILLVVLSIRLAARFYLDGWIRLAPMAETRRVRSERYTFLLRLLPSAWRPVLWKDLTIVARDFRVSFQLYSLGLMMCLFPFMTLSASEAGDATALAPLTALACAVGASVVVGAQAGLMLVPLEAKSAWRLLGSPLPPQQVAAVKWTAAILLTLPVVVAQWVLLRLVFNRSWLEAIDGGVIAFAASLVGSAFGLWAGASFANFQWDHPRRMITPGAQIVWALGVGLITGGMVFFSQVSLWGGEGLLPSFPGSGTAVASLVVALVIGVLTTRSIARRLGRQEWGGVF